MTKHADHTDPILSPLTAEIARILDLEGTRTFDGHFVVDQTGEGVIEGAVLHAHDKATVATFSLTVTVS